MRRKYKCIRIETEPLKQRIMAKYVDFAKASKVMGRSHDYVAGIFRQYAGRIEFPEVYLTEFEQKLGIEYKDLVRKNKPRCQDNQISFDDLVASVQEGITKDRTAELIEAINALTDEIRNMRNWRIGIL